MAPYSLRGLSFSNTLSRKPLIMGPRGKHSSDAGSGRFTPVSKCFRLATSAPSKTPLTWGTHKMALCAHDTIYWGPQSSAKRRRRAIPAASCCCSGPHLTHFTRGAQCPLSPPPLAPPCPFHSWGQWFGKMNPLRLALPWLPCPFQTLQHSWIFHPGAIQETHVWNICSLRTTKQTRGWR